mgnify:CR=1 FL=1
MHAVAFPHPIVAPVAAAAAAVVAAAVDGGDDDDDDGGCVENGLGLCDLVGMKTRLLVARLFVKRVRREWHFWEDCCR